MFNIRREKLSDSYSNHYSSHLFYYPSREEKLLRQLIRAQGINHILKNSNPYIFYFSLVVFNCYYLLLIYFLNLFFILSLSLCLWIQTLWFRFTLGDPTYALNLNLTYLMFLWMYWVLLKWYSSSLKPILEHRVSSARIIEWLAGCYLRLLNL